MSDQTDPSASLDDAEFPRLLDDLRVRCDAASYDFELTDSPTSEHWGVVSLPAGREKRRIVISNLARARNLAAIPFEQYTFLGAYEAICSYEEGRIEAAIQTAGGPLSAASLFRMRQLLREDPDSGTGEVDPENLRDWSVSRVDGVQLGIGRATPAFRALASRPGGERALTIKIEGVAVEQHDKALHVLETFANALFFQLEAAFGLPLSLRRRRPPFRGRRQQSPMSSLDDVAFPSYEYDPQPMSLYWYGAGAVGMPLLQFLAYYQAIEFYFPVYSEHEARRRLRNVLKDPLFDPESDTALARAMTAVNLRRSGGYGSERDQLRSTITECVHEGELVAFITQTTQSAEFFRAKHPGLTAFQIRIGDGLNARDQVAERIYDIRCRIVHAKDSDEQENVILPFSGEAELLGERDIDLVQFIARQVLIAASRPISV